MLKAAVRYLPKITQIVALGLSCIYIDWVEAAPTVAALSEEEQFFETQIRPLLVESCFKCHGAEKQKGGLRLDSPKAALKGGDSGAAMVPGDLKASLMIRAIHYGAGDYAGEELEMPPKKKLAAGQIALLERWVEMGAPWPESSIVHVESNSDPRAAINAAGKKHWAFQPVSKPPLPDVKNKAWPKTAIDRFVLAKLEAAKIQPSPRASERTLLRRAFLDLTGMPPSPEVAQAFLKSPNFDKLCSDLLENTNYGERWGRHWLDVARYADSKGAIFGETKEYPYAYTYRDYVIQAFNDDKPFDQFVREQLAADMIPGHGKNDPSLAALGFLTVHRRSNAGGMEEQWADRVDTVGRGMLGLTVACARCHDHKYDPISTDDFYALYGVFASIEEPKEFPVISRPQAGSKLDREFQEFLKAEDRNIQSYIDETHDKIMKRFRGQVGEYLLVVNDLRDQDDQALRTESGRRKLSPEVALRWKTWLKEHPDEPVFEIWRAFATLPEKGFAAAAAELAGKILDPTGLGQPFNPVVAQVFSIKEPPPTSLKEVAERYQSVFTKVDVEWEKRTSQNPEHPPAGFADDNNREQLRKLLYGPEAPGVMPAGTFAKLDRPAYLALIRKRAERELRLAMHPGSPRRAMVVHDKAKLYDPYVYIRGNKDRKGDEVSRRFLERLGGSDEKAFPNGSGRLDLANAIVSPDNPLTARVIVNRIWSYHFGRGLVPTPSDFGLRADKPSHPKLLDWLASDFMEHGWSIKHLHRLIMSSAVYQQTSHSVAENFPRDPENRLLWRFNRRRMEFEAIRDSMLAVSGKLDTTRGGPAALIVTEVSETPDKVSWQVNPYRRTVYAAVERDQVLPQLLTFDVASPDETSSRRDITTVPTQSLFMMNSEFPMEMAAGVTEQLGLKTSDSNESDAAIKKLYFHIFQRNPSAGEAAAARAFIESATKDSVETNSKNTVAAAVNSKPNSDWQFGYASYDRITGKHGIGGDISSFPFHGPEKMQGSAEFPDQKNGFGWLQLRPAGGHAAGGGKCIVSRWTSPVAGVIEISGDFIHSSEIGDGVRATIYRNHSEQLGQWIAHNKKADTRLNPLAVEKGDIIDFVVDSIAGGSYDSYQWNPLIVPTQAVPPIAGRTAWSPKRDFPKPPTRKIEPKKNTAPTPDRFGPWEQLVQVLLMSNEFVNIE